MSSIRLVSLTHSDTANVTPSAAAPFGAVAVRLASMASVLLLLTTLPAGARSLEGPAAQKGASDTLADCQLTFDAVWSAATHPTDFPSNPHFSPLIGGTHHDGVVFWDGGQTATPGIVEVAETGGTFTFRNEVQDAIDAGTARNVISGGGIGLSPGSASTSFSADLSHPLATVVTMIAPSPDWFLGVHGLPLFDNGRWVSSQVVQLPPYDAGSDSGMSYGSPDIATIPVEPIAVLSGFPFSPGTSLGTFTFDCTSNLMFRDGFESGTPDVWDQISP